MKAGDVLSEELVRRLQALSAGGVLASETIPVVGQFVPGR
jgi:hypothetical protein